MNAWAEQGDFEFDFGGVVLNRLDGRKISQAVGTLGFAWYWPYVEHWNVFGYPAGRPFNGKYLQTCQASVAAITGFDVPEIGIGCDMTGGSSGGPFVVDFGHGYYLNGNVSNSVVGFGEELYSPYFGDCAHAMYQTLADSTPGTPAPPFECSIP